MSTGTGCSTVCTWFSLTSLYGDMEDVFSSLETVLHMLCCMPVQCGPDSLGMPVSFSVLIYIQSVVFYPLRLRRQQCAPGASQ
jgi:hypothetical protein